MPPAARITDIHACVIPAHNPPHPVVSGSGDTVVGAMPAARVGDTEACGAALALGSSDVMINNRLATRMGDTTAHGGKIILGFPTVLIGESPQSSTLKLAAKNGTPFCEECEKARRAEAAAEAAKKHEPPEDSVVVPPPGPNTPPPDPPQVVLKDVKPETVALAASEGSSPAQQKARAEVARAFYQQHAVERVPVFAKDANGRPIFLPPVAPGALPQKKVEKWVEAAIAPAKIRSHIRGIDFKKPVSFGPQPPVPSDLSQWQAPNGYQGSYYADAKTTPDELGIHHSASSKPGQAPVPKIALPYKMHPSGPYLKSTSGKIKDTWSVYRRAHQTYGGGTQYFVPNTAHAVKA